MLRLLVIPLILLTLSGIASKEQLREMYWRAEDDVAIRFFYDQAQKEKITDAVVLAYLGVATAMQAQVAEGISDKLRYFSEGKDKIEEAVKLDPNNPEIRFLRFSVQSEVPAILGYRSDIGEDYDLVLYYLNAGQYLPSREYCIRMKTFMMASEVLDKNQKNQLKNISIS